MGIGFRLQGTDKRPVFPVLALAFVLCAVSGDVPAQTACPDGQATATTSDTTFLRAVTLNLAHGRKDGLNQLLQSAQTINNNLVDVARVLKLIDGDLVALQEADAASSWSGGFNHVDFLAGEAGYPCTYHGVHASNPMYEFGTALLSKHPFKGTFSYSFRPSRPTINKGFVIGALDWNPAGALPEPVRVRLVSVHLDYSRRSVRRSQIDEMVGILAKIDGPMVVMGDFNTDWLNEGSSLKYLAGQLDLEAFKPHAEGQGTYGKKNLRLDWILISPELSFRKYAVIPDIISDHYAVVAEIELQDRSLESSLKPAYRK